MAVSASASDGVLWASKTSHYRGLESTVSTKVLSPCALSSSFPATVQKLDKGLGSGADALLLDLEDSISPQNKAQARATTWPF